LLRSTDAEVIRGKIVDIKSFLDQNAPIDQILQAIGEADEICSPIIHEAVKRVRQRHGWFFLPFLF
jgi:hypothetical protein